MEFRRIQQTRDAAIKKAWGENWETSTDQEEAIHHPEIKWPNISMETGVGKPIHILEPIKPIPPMDNWVLSPRNYMSESENHFMSFPFISDKKSYGGKAHEWTGKEFGVESDGVFVELVEALKAYVPFKERYLFPNPIIFDAMSKYSLQSATPSHLKLKYDQLVGKKQERIDTQVPMFNAFNKYFCRSCYTYGCELHRKNGNFSLRKKTQFEARHGHHLKTTDEPCGPNCYKLLQPEYQTGQTVEDASFSEVNNLGKPFDWSDDEKMLFQALHKIFPENNCIITQAMLSQRTCREVYEFSQKENKSSNKTAKFGSTGAQAAHYHRKTWSFYQRQRKANSHGSFNSEHSYTPCHHEEKECTIDCCCVSERNACEKYCHCSLACTNRFPGCTCRGQCNTKKCPCFLAERECDADLCQNCGASNYDISQVECKNVSIQRGLRKHLLLAPSDVAGWGIFLKSGVKRNEFISEYCGEIITQEEADRRGQVYDMQNSSFLFELNKDYVIDATYRGSKIRFANHSINPNCYAKVMMVLGNHRIGIFAKRDISPGEELVFDYRYGLTETLKFVSIEREVQFV